MSSLIMSTAGADDLVGRLARPFVARITTLQSRRFDMRVTTKITGTVTITRSVCQDYLLGQLGDRVPRASPSSTNGSIGSHGLALSTTSWTCRLTSSHKITTIQAISGCSSLAPLPCSHCFDYRLRGSQRHGLGKESSS